MIVLVARAQLDFVTDLVTRFGHSSSTMGAVADYQSRYIAIITLLRSVGHVFEKVDCTNDAWKSWCHARWPEWKTVPIFADFIEPTRNALLKEFQGGLQLHNAAFGSVAIVTDASSASGISRVSSFDAAQLRDGSGQLILPKIHEALAFWDRCLTEAEAELPKLPR